MWWKNAVKSLCLACVAAILDGSSYFVCAVALANPTTDDGDGLVRIKLIPHHAQRRRRQRELRRLKLEEGFEEEGADREALLAEELASIIKDRPHQYHRWDRRMDENPAQVAELFQGYGTHYVDLWVGKPAQRQTVIVDTGSGVTAFPCEGCGKCGVPKYHSDGLFMPKQSSTFKKLTCSECLRGRCSGSSDECRVSMSYQEGSSWSAFESEDSCYAGGLHSNSVALDPSVDQDDLNPFLAAKFAFRLKFGCQTHLTGLFITQLADGIMGLDNARASYNQQMERSKKIPTKQFSLCYSRQDVVDPDGTESGAFTLGGTDKRMHKTPMVWTKGGGNGGFYAVKIRNIYMRSGNSGLSAQSSDPNASVTPLGLSTSTYQHGQVIVDSGTTDTYFSRSLASKFSALFNQLSGKQYGHRKQHLSLEEVRALPTILIQLEGEVEINKKVREHYGAPVPGLAEDVDPNNPYDVLLAVPPTHYMEYDPDEDNWVNRFYTDEASGGVIGGNSMMGHDVLFDVDAGHLGWSESDCDYTALVKKYIGPGTSPTREENPVAPPVAAPVAAPVAPPVAPPVAAPVAPPVAAPVAAPVAPPVVEPPHGGIPVIDDDLVTPEPKQFCSSLSCQAALLSTVVLIVVLVTLGAINRRSKAAYQLTDPAAAAELEMQDAAGAIGSDGVIRYRDEPEQFEDEARQVA